MPLIRVTAAVAPSSESRQLPVASAPGPRRLGARISGDLTLRLARDTSPVAHLPVTNRDEARALFDGAGRPGPGDPA
jgi:hypothetical protein